jgi:hypothetical protein
MESAGQLLSPASFAYESDEPHAAKFPAVCFASAFFHQHQPLHVHTDRGDDPSAFG